MLPVVMVTASGARQRLRALEVGADDFITKPFDQAELMARVRSLARVKRLHDTVVEQTVALERWNAELESRVAEQVADLERLGRLRRFLSPQIAGLIVESGDESFLESHRRDITTVFTDLRGFTAFAETSEPEETMSVLRDYHAALGELVFAYEGTLEHFAGDGLMVFFNDPPPCADAPERAVRMAVADARPGRRARDALAPAGPRPRLRRRASPRVTPRSAGSASRGGGTTPPSGPSPTWLRGCVPPPRAVRCSSARACVPASTRASRRTRSAPWSCAASHGPSRCTRSSAPSGRRTTHERGHPFHLPAGAVRGPTAGRRARRPRRGRTGRALRRPAGTAARGVETHAPGRPPGVRRRRPVDDDRAARAVCWCA